MKNHVKIHTFQYLISMFYDYRLRAAGKANAGGAKKSRTRDRCAKGIQVPEANAELQANIDVCQIRHLIHLSKYF